MPFYNVTLLLSISVDANMVIVIVVNVPLSCF